MVTTDRISKTIYRHWAYAHRGYTYARFLITLINFLTIQFIAWFKDTSSTTIQAIQLLSFGLLFMTICDVIGQWDYKKGTYDSIVEIQRKSNRYDRIIAKGLQYLISKHTDSQALEIYDKLEQWTTSMRKEGQVKT